MAKPKHNTELGIRRRRKPHPAGIQEARVELAAGDTAWHPYDDEPIPGPATVTYHFHDDGDIGVIIYQADQDVNVL